jgi:DNA polymerase/3'-5' exonuclease PolX
MKKTVKVSKRNREIIVNISSSEQLKILQEARELQRGQFVRKLFPIQLKIFTKFWGKKPTEIAKIFHISLDDVNKHIAAIKEAAKEHNVYLHG